MLHVQAVAVNGKVTLNGAVPVDDKGCASSMTAPKAYVNLTEPTLGYQLAFAIPCNSASYAFSGEVPSGTYQVTVTGVGGPPPSTNLPAVPVVINPALSVTAATSTLTLDVTAFKVAGAVTLNGAPPANCPAGSLGTFTKALVRFDDTSRGTTLFFDKTCSDPDYTFSWLIPPGTYKVTVAGDGPVSNLPPAFVAAPALTIAAPMPNTGLDVKTVPVSGAITVNGAAPTNCPANYLPTTAKAAVTFTETTYGNATSITIPCGSPDYSFSGTVPSGTYQVTVSGIGAPFTNLPSAEFVVLPSLALTAAATNLSLDVKPISVGGKITLEGAVPVDGMACATAPTNTKALIFFKDTFGRTQQWNIPCSATNYEFSGVLAAGTYEVSVQGWSSTTLPARPQVVASALTVTAPMTALVFDAKAMLAVGGKITLNAVVPVNGMSCASHPTNFKAIVTLTETGTGARTMFDLSCNTADYAFTGSVLPGTYQVEVSGFGAAWTNLPTATYVYAPALVITTAMPSLAVDVKTVPVSGTVTLNGAAPADGPGCTGNPMGQKALVVFTDVGRGQEISLPIPCSPAGYAFSGALFPGSYRVTVAAPNAALSNLPASYVAIPRLLVP
jgi:hypothetical protein